MLRYALLMSLGATLIVDVADNVPELDIQSSCKASMEFGLALTRNPEACMRTENAARAELIQKWPTYSEADRRRCLIGPEAGRNSPSYVEILTCLDIVKDTQK